MEYTNVELKDTGMESEDIDVRLGNIDRITLENFRVFQERQEFEMRPLTFLIGKNNSGKSSIWKALMLLAENVKRKGWASMNTLDFEGRDHGLNNFEHAVSYNYSVPVFLIGWVSEIEENTSIQIEVEYLRDDRNIVQLNKLKLQSATDKTVFIEVKRGKSIFIDFLAIYEKSKPTDSIAEPKREGGRGSDKLNKFSFEFFRGINGNENIFKANDEIVRSFLLDNQENLLDQVTPFFNRWADTQDFNGNISIIDGIQKYITQFFDPEIAYFLDDDKISYSDKKEDQNLIITPDGIHFFTQVNSILRGWISSLFYVLSREMQHIGSFRGKSKIFYDKNDLLGQLSFEYTQQEKYESLENTNKENRLQSFLTSLLSKHFIDISSNPLKISAPVEGSLFKIEVERNGRIEDLTSLGVGTVQLIPLLLKIALSSGKTLVVEEPENSLHPNYQSKLANVFVDAYKKHDVRFIVETHSEYIIRQIQYLILSKDLNKEDVLIYYLDPSDTEEPIRKIVISERGKLSRRFGTGFFDETALIMKNAIEIRNNQKNNTNENI